MECLQKNKRAWIGKHRKTVLCGLGQVNISITKIQHTYNILTIRFDN